ncbi:MAG: FkbM family methyltransferase [Candidatus Staskawiczbacteria bacterium]|nr:FkbM family methyltransferase [Candidatus Staskawiczbacteria bacterium]
MFIKKIISKARTAINEVKSFENFFTYFADHFGLVKNKYIIYRLRGGAKYKVRSGSKDRGIIDEIYTHRCYTPQGFEIKEEDTVVDIGAHIGVFSIFAARLAKNGKIFSFEPTPENFMMLRENIEINKIKNVFPINKAVLDTTGQATIFLDENNHGVHSFFNFGGRSQLKKIMVDTISLDDFVRGNNIFRIDFLKMDCEGSEYKILFNCSKKTLGIIKKISMEYHDSDENDNVRSLVEFLENNGFKVMIKPGNYSLLYAGR